MTASDIYWYKINQKNIIIDIFFLIAFPFLLAVFGNIIFLYFIIRLFMYSSQFISMSHFNLNFDNKFNHLLTMPFSRKQIYITYIKMPCFQALVYIISFLSWQLIAKVLEIPYKFYLFKYQLKNNNLTLLIFYISFIVIILFVINSLSNIITNYCKDIFFFFISNIIYIIFTLIWFSILIYSEHSTNYINIQFLLIGFDLIILIVLIINISKNIKENYIKFVLKYRRFPYA